MIRNDAGHHWVGGNRILLLLFYTGYFKKSNFQKYFITLLNVLTSCAGLMLI